MPASWLAFCGAFFSESAKVKSEKGKLRLKGTVVRPPYFCSAVPWATDATSEQLLRLFVSVAFEVSHRFLPRR